MDQYRDSGTEELIAMRQGRISVEEYESRNGITDVNDSRHEAWIGGTLETRDIAPAAAFRPAKHVLTDDEIAEIAIKFYDGMNR